MLNSKQQAQPKHTNYLTQENNCSVISCSSEHPRGLATNMLSSNPRQLWLTNQKLPQQCVMSLKKISKRPTVFNMIGFYCWHQYDSNPALIEVYFRADQNSRWRLVGKIRLARVASWQYFKIQDVESINAGQLKIKIVQNFGGDNTYINKIGLFHNNIKQSLGLQQQAASHQQSPINPQQKPLTIPMTRQKTHSEHQPWGPASSQMQRQLKKANDQIIFLVEQQQKMKKTILQQQKIIIKIQQTLKTVVMNMDKMQKIQQIYAKNDFKSANRQYYRSNQDADQRSKNGKLQQTEKGRKNGKIYGMNQYQFDNQDEIQISQNKRDRKKHIQNRQQNKQDKIEHLKNKIQSFERQQLKKAQKTKTKVASQSHSDHPQRTQIIATNSQQQLSQYSHPQGHYTSQNEQYLSANKYKTSLTQNQYQNSRDSRGKDRVRQRSTENKENRGDKTKMLERLKKLIELKEKKKLQLKNSVGGGHMASWGKSRPYDGYQDDQEDDQYDENQ